MIRSAGGGPAKQDRVSKGTAAAAARPGRRGGLSHLGQGHPVAGFPLPGLQFLVKGPHEGSRFLAVAQISGLERVSFPVEEQVVVAVVDAQLSASGEITRPGVGSAREPSHHGLDHCAAECHWMKTWS